MKNKILQRRCLYTTQKTKKRKTWSDGAVTCCVQRSLVSLFRWSDALGIAGAPLGEAWLSQPEFVAFVTAAEPELEMDAHLVSLDGVVENCPPPANPPAAGGPAVAAAATAIPAAAGEAAPQPALANRKKRLFRAFKAPKVTPPQPPPQPGMRW
ncbi:unnamed protein product, partial [Phaeothamnion confervicola]